MEQLFRLLKTEPSLRQLFRCVLEEGKKPTKEMLASIPKRILRDPAMRENLETSISLLCYSDGTREKSPVRNGVEPEPELETDNVDTESEEQHDAFHVSPDDRQISAYFRDMKQFPLLEQEETQKLFQQLEEKRASLRKIIASHTVGMREILQRGKAVITEEDSIRNFAMTPNLTKEGLENLRVLIEVTIARLEYLEHQAGTHGRDAYVGEIVSLLDSLSLEHETEESALDAVEASLSQENKDVSTLRKERALWTEIRNTIVASNLRFAINVAGRYKYAYPFSDLMQEAAIGLMRAVEKYEWRRGYTFPTYAFWWVRQTINRAINNKNHIIRIPIHTWEKCNKLRRKEYAFVQLIGRSPTDKELAEFAGFTTEEIKTLREAMMPNPISLNEPMSRDANTEFGDLIADENTCKPEDAAALDRLRAVEDRFLEKLSPREEKIVRMRFALGEDDEYTLEEVGEKFAVTRERIRQLEAKALQKLKGMMEQAGIRDHLVDDAPNQQEPLHKFIERIRELHGRLQMQETVRSKIVHEVLSEIAARHDVSISELISENRRPKDPLSTARRETVWILNKICACSTTKIVEILHLQPLEVVKALRQVNIYLKAQKTIIFS